MLSNVDVSRELGYLTVADDTLIRLDDVSLLPDHEVTIITTGAQGEPLSALTRMVEPGGRLLVFGGRPLEAGTFRREASPADPRELQVFRREA